METARTKSQPPLSTAEGQPAKHQRDHRPRLRRGLDSLQGMPAWLVSLVLHVVLLILLALVTVTDPMDMVSVWTARSEDAESFQIEDFPIAALDASQSVSEQADQRVEIASTLEVTQPSMKPLPKSVDVDLAELMVDSARPPSPLQSLSQISPQQLGSRSGDAKQELLREYGGNQASERAVAEALEWLARHQMANGSWTFRHDLACDGGCGDPGASNRARAVNAATALALLPFLGAGQTHLQGRYKKQVGRGLKFLLENGRPGKKAGLHVLDLSESFYGIMPGNLYSHGFAAITLCEAYAMTKDPELRQPAQNALNYIVYAQCKDGGWKYFPKDPNGGDTSVTGWQVMALKSGLMGNLDVPKSSLEQSMRFLNKVQSNGGAMYGYMYRQTEIIPSCTAVGLLCRMYLGWDKQRPGLVNGVGELSQVGVLKDDLYYDYYAAQVMRHFGGTAWTEFNAELRDWLIETQSDRRDERGSWYFPDSESLSEGGRLANTAFAAMILEVYYRHMPLYAQAATSDEFPL